MNELIGVLLALLGSATLLQIAPVKIDPWTWLARKLGQAINGEVIRRMEKLEQAVAEIQQRAEERAAVSARIRILRFGDEILHGVHHSKEHFDQVLLDITEYEQYCRDHPDFANQMTVLTQKHIMETYSACFERQTFL